jgi:hypothetical protein
MEWFGATSEHSLPLAFGGYRREVAIRASIRLSKKKTFAPTTPTSIGG